ncbi:MAG: hypothetical protein E7313_02720 [Clostridiales bacterium]|nr:hypothetical protein [Clostridiales bacterium]
MHNNYINSTKLEKQIEEMKGLLMEIQHSQIEEIKLIKSNNCTNMKKFDKIQEYNKIADMTNQLFEKRLLQIEQSIILLNNYIRDNKR